MFFEPRDAQKALGFHVQRNLPVFVVFLCVAALMGAQPPILTVS